MIDINDINQTRRRRIKVVAVVLLCLVLLVSVASVVAIQYVRSSNRRLASASVPEAKPAIQRSISISATQLAREYADNQVKADEDYKEKVLHVSGIASRIGKDHMGNPYVVMYRSATDMCGVQALITKETALRLRKGKPITVIGTCYGKGTICNIIMYDCVVQY